MKISNTNSWILNINIKIKNIILFQIRKFSMNLWKTIIDENKICIISLISLLNTQQKYIDKGLFHWTSIFKKILYLILKMRFGECLVN